MLTMFLVITLITGDRLAREVPAADCPRLAYAVIQQPDVTTAQCWTSATATRPVFSTVAM